MARVVDVGNQGVSRRVVMVGKSLDQRFGVLVSLNCNVSNARRKDVGLDNGCLWQL